MASDVCIVRGGGDLATGVVWRLTRSGVPVIVTELAHPLAIRRTVSVSTAVTDGTCAVEGMSAVRVGGWDEARRLAGREQVPVVVSPDLPPDHGGAVVVDARLAKRPLDTTIDAAPFVVGLGPGFVVGEHCHAVVETNRGHHLGRVLWHGAAEPDTGTPGVVGGRGAERVVRAPVAGRVAWDVEIGQLVGAGERLGTVEGTPFSAELPGVVRGTIASGTVVDAGTKIGDVDPRGDVAACSEISDKALAIGGGVVEAVMTWSRSR